MSKMRKHLLTAVALFCGLCALPSVASATPVPIDEAHFPDPAFREYLNTETDSYYDSNKDGYLSDEELCVTYIYLFDLPDIKDITGIEYFINAHTLSVEGCNNLEYIDISKNPKLERVNIQKNSKLQSVKIDNKKLTSLDLSHNVSLRNIDFTKAPNLTSFGSIIDPNSSMEYITTNNKVSRISPDKYEYRGVLFNTNGGTSINKTYFHCDKTISLNDFVPTKKNATFDGWYSDVECTEPVTSFSFKRHESPMEDTTLYAKWIPSNNDENVEEKPEQKPEVKPIDKAFSDVKPTDYYYEPVQWAVRNGIASGTSATTFSPKKQCTRAEAVTFLWNQAGKPQATGTNSLADVPADAYYAQAVQWAVEQGITSGTSATSFSPNTVCNRNQIITFMWRAAGMPQSSGTSHFADVPADAYYADAVQWAVDNKITSGISATQFAPTADCIRGQIVTFMYNNR